MTGAINKLIKLQLALLALLTASWGDLCATAGSTNSAPADRILIVEPSSMSVAGGTVNLTIGALQRVNGVYLGNYKIKVFPYFLKNEKGSLAIIVSDESLAAVNHGKVAAIVGTATTSGKGGISRHIDARALPSDLNHGMLIVRFMVGDRKMIFEPAYHFSGKETATVLAQPAGTNFASYLQPDMHVSHNEALAVATSP